MVTSTEEAAEFVARRSMPSWPAQPAFLYVAVPLAVAVAFTTLRAGFAALLPLHLGLLVWLLLILPTWWGAQLASLLAHRLLRPWAPPLWFICIVGSIGQALALSPWLRTVYAWAERLAGTGLHGDWPLPEFSLRYAATLVVAMAPGALLWLGVNYAYDRLLGVPRFRYPRASDTVGVPGPLPVGEARPVADSTAAADESAAVASPAAVTATAPTTVPSPLLARSRLPADAEIRAITAEEHYVRLYTDRGRDLVRYRFSDALDALAHVPGGVQVHRSWWVRLDRVADVVERGRAFDLVLDDGLRVPVSLAFRSAVRQRLRDRGRR